MSVLIDRMGAFWQDVAKSEGIPDDIIDVLLTRFAILSTRVDFGGAVDFELALPNDSPETIREKFMTYLDSESVDAIEEAQRLIRAKDAPANGATAPEGVADGDSKKK